MKNTVHTIDTTHGVMYRQYRYITVSKNIRCIFKTFRLFIDFYGTSKLLFFVVRCNMFNINDILFQFTSLK